MGCWCKLASKSSWRFSSIEEKGKKSLSTHTHTNKQLRSLHRLLTARFIAFVSLWPKWMMAMIACKSCIRIVSRFLCARAISLHFLSIFWCCSCFSLFKFYKHKHKHKLMKSHPCMGSRTHTCTHLALTDVWTRGKPELKIGSNHTHAHRYMQTHMCNTQKPRVYSPSILA